MKPPIAKLREDVVKAAMAEWMYVKNMTAEISLARFARLIGKRQKACAALEKRTKK